MTMADKTPAKAATAPAKATAVVEKEAKKCPITKAQFIDSAKPILVKIGDKDMIAAPKSAEKLADGSSFGWYCGDKIVVVIDGVPVQVMVGLNLTVVNSKTTK